MVQCGFDTLILLLSGFINLFNYANKDPEHNEDNHIGAKVVSSAVVGRTI